MSSCPGCAGQDWPVGCEICELRERIGRWAKAFRDRRVHEEWPALDAVLNRMEEEALDG